MLGQPIVLSTQRAERRVSAGPRVAVLLNARARRVTPRVVRALSHVVERGDLYLSRSELDARRIAGLVLERGYDAVFCGGGDGTFMGFADEILNQAARASREPPRFGVLKLGTGNGIASYVGASDARGGGMLEDVLRARAGEASGVRSLDLLQVEGRRAQFAGLGADAQILNDYVGLTSRLTGRALQRFLTGWRGYAAAVVLRTLPQLLARPLATFCEVRNTAASPAWRLGPDGGCLEEFAPGATLFEGKMLMAGASTIPFYGYGLRMFPFAGMAPGTMQFRVGNPRATSLLAHLPQFWRGEWFPDGRILDFRATRVSVRFDRPVPLQIGGDAAGSRREVEFAVAPERLELIDFRRPAVAPPRALPA